MSEIYVLWFQNENDEKDEDRLIGVYSDRLHAEEALNKATNCNSIVYTGDCMMIVKYKLGQDHWTEGYFTWSPDDEQ